MVIGVIIVLAVAIAVSLLVTAGMSYFIAYYAGKGWRAGVKK